MKNQDVNSTDTSLKNLNLGGSPYPFSFLQKTPYKDSAHRVCEHIYNFKSKYDLKYQVNVMEYKIGVFAVKFHLKKHHKQPNRYQLLSNNGDAITVIKTIVAIMHSILEQNKTVSFAFIGMPNVDEENPTTKRYKVYEKFCRRYFSPSTFDHLYDESKSFYMLLNKKSPEKNMGEKIISLALEEMRSDSTLRAINFGRSTA